MIKLTPTEIKRQKKRRQARETKDATNMDKWIWLPVLTILILLAALATDFG